VLGMGTLLVPEGSSRSVLRRSRQKAEGRRQERLYSKLFKLFQLDSYFCRAALVFLRGLCLWCCCLLLLVGCSSTKVNEGITIQVQRVVSGQTLEVLNPESRSPLIERVRFIGIDVPDLKQRPWGPTAKKRLEQILSSNTLSSTTGEQPVLQPVFLESDAQKKDSFGRWLAYIWNDGVLLNEQLVREGYALAVPRAPNNKYDERIARAQEYARIMGYGIWNPDKPMRSTPAEFRLQNP